MLSLAVLGRRARAVLPLLASAATLVLFTTAPQWRHPVPATWGLFGNLIGNCYVFFGAALLVGAAFLPLRTRRDVKPDAATRPGTLSQAWVSESAF
jgi:hypothetical protein